MIMQTLGVVIVLSVIVVIHEYGHFLSARSVGVSVQEFSIGVGPAIWQRQGKSVLLSIRCLPFGGYCLFDSDLQGVDHKGRPLSILGRKAPTKMLISIAGPGMNFVLAAIIFTILFSFIGITVGYEPVIGGVQEGSSAMEAGILPGDRILSIEGEALGSWQDISRILAQKKDGVSLVFAVQRGDKQMQIPIKPRYIPDENRIMIGVTVDADYAVIQRFSPGKGIRLGLQQTSGMIQSLLKAICDMLTGRISVSDNLSGPVALTQMIAETVSSGLSDTLFLTAFLSVNLGIMNLLPIPALDGGRMILYIVEMIRRKPLKTEVEGWINTAGVALILTLMLVLTYKDIMKAFGG